MVYKKDVYRGIDACASFAEFLEKINKKYGDSVAFQSRDEYWTYNDLYLLIRQCCPYFIHSNKKYFYINIDSPVYFCVMLFSIIISGKVAVLARKEQIPIEEAEQIETSDVQRILNFNMVCETFILRDVKQLSVLALSSGTTSVSKGVMLSQFNLLSDTFAGARIYGYPQGAVYLNVVPYTHLFGIVADMLGPLASGGTICFSTHVVDFFRDLQFFKPTHMNLPPSMVYTIEKAIKQKGHVAAVTGGRLKKIMCAGARIEDASVHNMKGFGVDIFAAYGLTECSPCISMNVSSASKVGSVGKILPCCAVKIVDGEVTVRGDIVMLGYWNDEISTKSIMSDGWLFTGDMGYIDEDGFLFLTGRKSNLIVFENGEKLIPEVLEAELNAVAGVEESLISAVNVANRILLKITIVSLKNDTSVLEEAVQLCLKNKGMINRVESIAITTKVLEKNKLGKILRKKII